MLARYAPVPTEQRVLYPFTTTPAAKEAREAYLGVVKAGGASVSLSSLRDVAYDAISDLHDVCRRAEAVLAKLPPDDPAGPLIRHVISGLPAKEQA